MGRTFLPLLEKFSAFDMYMSASCRVVLILTYRWTDLLKLSVLFPIAQLGLHITGNANLEQFEWWTMSHLRSKQSINDQDGGGRPRLYHDKSF